MNIEGILQDLRHERGRLDAAISALEGGTARRGRRPGSGQSGAGSKTRGRRAMSADARARIAAAQRARWAKQKRQVVPKTARPARKKPSGRKPMSPAMKKKLSAMMKARWAARKKAAA